MRIIILGANGQLGRAVVSQAVARGHQVTAFVRRSPSPTFQPSVEVQIGDAMQEGDLRAAMTDQDVVVNAIGAGTLRQNTIESDTTAVAVRAAQNLNISRYIAMSAGMVAIDWPIFRYVLFPLIFHNILTEHRRVEQIVIASSLQWTIVRPSRLIDGPGRGYMTSLQHPGSFSVSRQDVAGFILDAIESDTYVHQAVFIGSRRNDKRRS